MDYIFLYCMANNRQHTLSFCFGIGTYFFSFVSNSELAVAGTIGDSFGFVNSFFSTSALLFVIWSVKLQREEISLAQKEWQENTESQKRTSETDERSCIPDCYQ